MGFRGEALAAINSVSELALLSRPAATPAPPAGRAQRRAAPGRARHWHHGRGEGTVLSTPARRKFLKTDATELAHCIEAVRRHALARPDVGFAVWHEGKLVEQWRATTLERRAWPMCWARIFWRNPSP
jgi:DNA mismatch repair protein MutL